MASRAPADLLAQLSDRVDALTTKMDALLDEWVEYRVREERVDADRAAVATAIREVRTELTALRLEVVPLKSAVVDVKTAIAPRDGAIAKFASTPAGAAAIAGTIGTVATSIIGGLLWILSQYLQVTPPPGAATISPAHVAAPAEVKDAPDGPTP